MMMKRLLIVSLITTALAPMGKAQDLTISAAVSLKEAMTDVASGYRPVSGGGLQFNFAATGVLLAQIREGAPVDVFIAASDQQMDQAVTQKLVDPASRRVIAANAL